MFQDFYTQSKQNCQKLIQSIGQEEDSLDQHSQYLFQDDWIKISETEIPSELKTLDTIEFQEQKRILFEQISSPEQHIDFVYLAPFAETLLQTKEQSQMAILNHIIGFLCLSKHPWNKPNQSHIAYGVWNKPTRQLLAFSNSFCEMHCLTKDYLATHAFFHEDFSPLPQHRKLLPELFQQLYNCNVFYFETTIPCKSGKFANVRTYFLPNSLFYISIYEKCDFFSDCFVVDGLKFEPTFIGTQSQIPLETAIMQKYAKLKQILTQYQQLFEAKK